MEFKDTKELAEILNVHPETVRRWVKAKRIPYIKVGKRDFRFDVEKVIEALEGEE